MVPFERHLFVCVNERSPDNPKGCCASKNAEQIRSRLKQLAFEAGLSIAQTDELPSWKPGDEFEAARKEALAELD